MPDTAEIVGELYAVAGSRLGAYGYILTGSQHDGEELVQAAVVKTFVKRRRLADVRAAEAYVRATMRTLHIDRIRRDRHWSRLAPRITTNEQADDPTDAVLADDQIAQALATLPAQIRTAVALRYYDDLTVSQVASAMGLRDGTVKKYLAEGRDRLAPLLGVTVLTEVERADVEEIDVVEGARR